MLNLVLWLPIIGLLSIVSLRDDQSIRKAALAVSGLTLLLSWGLIASFDGSSPAIQLVEQRDWLPEMGLRYYIGVDGLSLPLLLLTTLISFVALLASNNIVERVKEYYCWFLVLQFSMMGVFIAQNWLLFYMFFEFTLIPIYFLIGIWGGKKRAQATTTIFLYTLTGSILMLLSIVALFIYSSVHSFDMDTLALQHVNWSPTLQIIIFTGFLIGFAVKVPAFPFHGWLNLAHVEAPTPLSMLLSGVLLKMGAYGLMRVSQLLPQAMEWFAYLLLVLGFINIIYGAVLAWRQTDLKSMVAFSSISHMGFVLIGISGLTAIGFTGATMQMVAHGIITGALFYMVGLIYYRTDNRNIDNFGGLVHKVPVYSSVTILTLFASMGLPGLVGFIAEFHILMGVLESSGLAVVLASIGIIVGASYSLSAINKIFMGSANTKWNNLNDMNRYEIFAVAPLVLLMIGLGLFPQLALNLMNATMVQMALIF
jgi:NADH-quinone oxidoreductase subunit M